MRQTVFLLTIGLTVVLLTSSKLDDGTCRKPGQSLQQYFRWEAGKTKPIIMGHRMSPIPLGYADNGFKTFIYTYKIAPCVLQEMDVRMSKDSVLMMLHDPTLERTTTGKGKLNQYTFKEAECYELKDKEGNILAGQHIPLLKDILNFVRKNAMIVILDMKPGTDAKRLMQEITATHTIDKVVVICYTIQDAEMLNKQYPTLMMALGFNSLEGIQAIEKSDLPYQNLIALTPSKLQDKKFYDKIHSMGVMVSFSAQGETDTYPEAKAIPAYHQIFNTGGDIICTDSLQKVFRAFN